MSRDEVAALYQRYGYFLWRRCRLILRDDAAARDALQETFVKLLVHGASIRDADEPLRWLCRVADRCCFDALRKSRRLSFGSPDDARFDEVGAHPNVDPALRSAVLSLLGRLSQDDQRLAVMAFVDGMTQGEIGAEVGWSRVTVNKRLQRIRERARRVLGNGHG
jgi:RNA polymerase sigma-70 factor (ECF subfamily)